ncbi:putative bifunctional diguanylate cyclase/phosphodiesterase [Pelagerythrobacter rhizovicinus]|uniref:EAL domain-containing protein n=1 Tax=Pelagerythrobacter rhizovicinus TaxID=2268576 RepID=A0A4V1QWH7_9SPHN|nr:EAL domain-containing protein [Pelagerythrobacter rhizovicinus]RXZ66196.1 EAL domain-containing protein [Pelagerythrobacter rhizovicinus]
MTQDHLRVGRIEDLQSLIDVMPNPVIVKSRDHRIVLINRSACALFGYSREVVVGFSDHDLFPAEQVAVFEAADNRVFDSGLVDEIEEQITDATGNTRTVITRKQRVRLNGQDLLVAVITDITAYREAEAHNRYLAFHDVLTGLPNRALLNERIDQILLRMPRTRAKCALIYVDLDRFKEVNDTFGHQAGDELIRQFASRLGTIVRASDTAARLGGDEFAILLQDTAEGLCPAEVCQRILDAAARPFTLSEGQAHVSASIGLIECESGGATRVELHQRADMALYQAKRDGRACFRIFTAALDRRIRDRRLLESELRHALVTGDGLKIDYQPLFETRGERLVAFEALVRWEHPRLGLLQPADFLDIAEESGLIIPLGDWVLERGCRTLSGWPEVSLAVNVSPGQLSKDGWVEHVLEILQNTGFDLSRLQLEVTEHTILDLPVAVEKLRQFRSAGIKIVLDDFGTGYSSLSHLQKLAIDKVKIDRSFVQDLVNERESKAIIRAVTRLGRSLGVSVTAEGVETEQQRSFVRALGCEEMQGFLLSKPLSEADTIDLLEHLARQVVRTGTPEPGDKSFEQGTSQPSLRWLGQ